MKKVFVSGCYDILHAGHIQFFKDARALGDHLTVCFASDEVLKIYKDREPSLPHDNKAVLIGSFSFVDRVVTSSDVDPIFDFVGHINRDKPDILAVTEDDRHQKEKQRFCKKYGIKFVVLPKTNPVTQVSTSKILRSISRTEQVPLRVDFAGGWLDVPDLARKGGFIVNCAISPLVSIDHWPYELNSGLGGSAAHAILDVKNGVVAEFKRGVGWQDPAIIRETGLCIWRSGKTPVLEAKYNPSWLKGKMLIYYAGGKHQTASLVSRKRDYDLIFKASLLAKIAVENSDIQTLAEAIGMSYEVQLGEKMKDLPAIKGAIAKKHLGGGHGGYALYLFKTKKDRDAAASRRGAKVIEPYIASSGF